MKKRFILKGIFILVLMAFIGGAFLLSRFVYTDTELADYYKNKTVKPVYKSTLFLKRHMHYTVISRSDTLPLLLLIHGAPGAWYGYIHTMDDSLLQQKFKMVSVDRLGYGKSDYGRAELSVPLQALAIKKVMDEENTSGKKVYLFGRSYGAPIAAWLAIYYPQQVEKLFMISPVIDPEKEKFFWFSSIGKWKFTQWFLPEFLKRGHCRKICTSVANETHAALMEALMRAYHRYCRRLRPGGRHRKFFVRKNTHCKCGGCFFKNKFRAPGNQRAAAADREIVTGKELMDNRKSNQC